MSIIKNIGNLPPDFRRTERSDKQSEIRRSGETGVKVPAPADKAQPKATDQVNLSDSAKILLQRESEVRKYSAELPNVETISIEDRKDIEVKIDSGFYSSPEVTGVVAGKIAAEQQIPKQGLTPTRMQQVIEKIRSNEYDSEDVLNVVADQIIKDLRK
mgnify:CR=1 FL=1